MHVNVFSMELIVIVSNLVYIIQLIIGSQHEHSSINWLAMFWVMYFLVHTLCVVSHIWMQMSLNVLARDNAIHNWPWLNTHAERYIPTSLILRLEHCL